MQTADSLKKAAKGEGAAHVPAMVGWRKFVAYLVAIATMAGLAIGGVLNVPAASALVGVVAAYMGGNVVAKRMRR